MWLLKTTLGRGLELKARDITRTLTVIVTLGFTTLTLAVSLHLDTKRLSSSMLHILHPIPNLNLGHTYRS